MTREERKQYAREYRSEGFGRIADARYYARNAEVLREKRRKAYARKKADRKTGNASD